MIPAECAVPPASTNHRLEKCGRRLSGLRPLLFLPVVGEERSVCNSMTDDTMLMGGSALPQLHGRKNRRSRDRHEDVIMKKRFLSWIVMCALLLTAAALTGCGDPDRRLEGI